MGFKNQSNLAGIAVEMDPAMEFLQYKMVAPTIQKVVSFHGSKSIPSFALKSVENLKMLGIELGARSGTVNIRPAKQSFREIDRCRCRLVHQRSSCREARSFRALA